MLAAGWLFVERGLREPAGETLDAWVRAGGTLIACGGAADAIAAAVPCFKNGGQWQDGAILNFGNGPQRLDENGWGYYLAIGWQF